MTASKAVIEYGPEGEPGVMNQLGSSEGTGKNQGCSITAVYWLLNKYLL